MEDTIPHGVCMARWMATRALRNLVVVLGDQLSRQSAAFEGFDAARDAVWMAEAAEESTYVWSHKLRIAVFLSAMRHFRDELRAHDRTVHYAALGERKETSLGVLLQQDVARVRPERVIVVAPGDYRMLTLLRDAERATGVVLEVRPDRSFYCSIEEFAAWQRKHPGLMLESFYREMRKRHRILIDANGEPTGGRWNFDAENREHFTAARRPGRVPPPKAFPVDAVTAEVIDLVRRRFPDHPGNLDHFSLPMTRPQARAMLRDFIQHRLASFGPYEDAMWAGQPFLFHSRLSLPLNLKLLEPRECVDAAVAALEAGRAPLRSVEGLVRQILGWRELVRGVYWLYMPEYAERNALGCKDVVVPRFFWDGNTEMSCVANAMQSVLDHGYTHHIQRLMVLGLFALLSGVHPRRFHEWHMAMYLDAIDWVSLPNALGMSQYGDGGVVGTKPYVASGSYIHRMSNYCEGCRYDPRKTIGDDACPFNALYWDFLARHKAKFEHQARMKPQYVNLARKGADLDDIRRRAQVLRRRLARGEPV